MKMLSMISYAIPVAQSQIEDMENLIFERKNLINVCKLVIKDLIDSTLYPDRRTIENESLELKNFFVVVENIFYHGFKGRKGFSLTSKKDLSPLIDVLMNRCADSIDIFKSIKEMTDIKTSLGRLRAWIKFSLMQKKLADHFATLAEQKDALIEIYDQESILLCDESSVFAGLLVGLNVLNCNLCLKVKNDDLDQTLRTVNYSLYLRERLPTLVDENESLKNNEKSDDELSKILDQNHYLEELNRRTKANVEQLQVKTQTLERSNCELMNELTLAKNEITELKNEINRLKDEKIQMENEYKKKIESTIQDIKTERETFQSSKTGLDNLYIVLQNRLQEEVRNRQETEKELETQISMKIELESAVNLMENSLVEKQDMLNTLRAQIEQFKEINSHSNENFNKSEALLRQKTNELDKLTKQNNELHRSLNDIELKLEKNNGEKLCYEQTCKQLTEQLINVDKKKNEYEKELNVERALRLQTQEFLDNEKYKLEYINSENEVLKDVKKEYEKLKVEHAKLKQKVVEQETTLEEMGAKLGHSRLIMEEVKEVNKQIHDFEWEKDENVTSCKLCEKEFNVARRKHHCRRCGRIFCHECSDNKLQLPSSSKPVRVCDLCRDAMIQQCAVTH